MKDKIWLIGAGLMAREYVKVLKQMPVDLTVIGRSEKSAMEMLEKTGTPVISGGLEKYLTKKPALPQYAIVAVNVEELTKMTVKLVNYGVKNILVEKPAGLTLAEIKRVYDEAFKNRAKVFVAYNRRFYASVIKARELIAEDGGVISFYFEFTEWSHVIEKMNKPDKVKAKMFLANSTHVVDLAFHLGGKPKEFNFYTAGGLPWHRSASRFAGAGITEGGAVFSYCANWEAPGRWGVEVLTAKRRLILRPLEKLQIQLKGSLEVDLVSIDDQLDIVYKPGLYRQVEAFLKSDVSNLCSIKEHYLNTEKYYYPMANYH
uniref:Gfo/Idh/MocA family oxidoreductase n=1 Tax=candidate division CPR3 bacterium TaxID=2268181 RepID=A0A7V3J931_UNCC3